MSSVGRSIPNTRAGLLTARQQLANARRVF